MLSLYDFDGTFSVQFLKVHPPEAFPEKSFDNFGTPRFLHLDSDHAANIESQPDSLVVATFY
jgi:hypothetical protein